MGEEDKKLLFQLKNGQLCVKTRTQQPTQDAQQSLGGHIFYYTRNYK